VNYVSGYSESHPPPGPGDSPTGCINCCSPDRKEQFISLFFRSVVPRSSGVDYQCRVRNSLHRKLWSHTFPCWTRSVALFYTSGPTVSAPRCADVLICANKSLQVTCDKFLSLSIKQIGHWSSVWETSVLVGFVLSYPQFYFFLFKSSSFCVRVNGTSLFFLSKGIVFVYYLAWN
jgi:hypothetical protein